MTKIIKNANGTYSMDENGKITENLKVVFDARKGCGDIKLPENEVGKKWLSESRFGDGITEIDLNNIPSRSHSVNNSTTVKTVKLSWIDFIADDDMETFTKIKEKAIKLMEKQQKLDEIQKYREIVEKLEAELGLN